MLPLSPSCHCIINIAHQDVVAGFKQAVIPYVCLVPRLTANNNILSLQGLNSGCVSDDLYSS